MAAASASTWSHVPPVEEVAQDAGHPVPRFLKAAARLQQAAWALHTDGSDCLHPRGEFDLPALCYGLHMAIQPFSSREVEASTNAAVVTACSKVARDLLVHLRRLEALPSGIKGINTNASGFCRVWPVDDVAALGSRLEDLARLWQDLHPGHELIHLIPRLSINTKETKEDDDHEHPKAGATKDTIAQEQPNTQYSSATDIFQKKPPAPRKVASGIINDFILESLAYKSMHNRENEVTKAHAKTFQWIYRRSASTASDQNTRAGGPSFETWLSGNEFGPIYWITGKPGSGKSTLMRYIFQNKQTALALRQWSQGLPTTLAGFFFWTSGSREQRSQTGMLRSLLHQLLSENPDHMAATFPELWNKLETMTTKERIRFTIDWTAPALMESFQSFLDVALPTVKICLCVDGLDEFEGDHHMIIDFFKKMGERNGGQDVKLCLSSRPWPVFEKAFEFKVPGLKLQDLTANDMVKYTRDRLMGDEVIGDLLKTKGDAELHLIERIINGADGVFLWVRLAVDQILQSPRLDVDVDHLHTLVESLPSELDDLFGKLLFENQGISETAETSVLFGLIRAREIVADFIRDETANSLSVWDFAMALDEEDDDMALKADVREASGELILSRSNSTAARIQHRFAGLLDLYESKQQGNMRGPNYDDEDPAVGHARRVAHSRVTYIHRTVRDWLMDADGIQERLLQESPAGFDAHLRLLRSYVLRLKNPLEEVEHHRMLDDWWPDISLTMTHARHIDDDPKKLQRDLVNEMEQTLSFYWRTKPQDPYDHWARNAFGSYEARMKAPPIWQPFLSLATKFGLSTYVAEELRARMKREDSDEADSRRHLEDPETTPLLCYATEFLCSRNKTIFPLSSSEMIKNLLELQSRLNPGVNHPYLDFETRKPRTTWITVLRHLRDAKRRGWIEYYDIDADGTTRWAEIIRLLVQDGEAEINAVVSADSWDPEITALGVLELLEETYGAVELDDLKQLVRRKRTGTEGVTLEKN